MTVFVIFTVLLGCANRGAAYAPVIEGWQQPPAKRTEYVIRKGDTLYSIAWAFNKDYRVLAHVNHLKDPYRVRPGQRLRIKPRWGELPLPLQAPARFPVRTLEKPSFRGQQKHRVVKSSARRMQQGRAHHRSRKASSVWPKPTFSHKVRCWRWPLTKYQPGQVIGRFEKRLGHNKGVDIKGRYGEPIRALARGRVVYAGSGLRGYGRLIIVKHNDAYLSAYAYNKRLLVKEGMIVKAGQSIATMGKMRSGRVALHLEIRRYGKPVNPLWRLKKKCKKE